MMASKILSRFLPVAEGGLDELILDGPASERFLEAGARHSEQDRFRDDEEDEELDNIMLEAAEEDAEDATLVGRSQRLSAGLSGRTPDTGGVPEWMQSSRSPAEEDDDVPPSLLMESRRGHSTGARTKGQGSRGDRNRTEAQWRAAQDQQRLHLEESLPPGPIAQTGSVPRGFQKSHLDAKDQALWRWTNVQNVDGFLLDVYQYFTEHGIWSILLSRTIYVLSTLFLFTMYMFLSSCVDFSKIPQSKSTSEILIPQCMKNTSFVKNVMLWIFVFWWSSTVFRYVVDVRRLWHLHEFYHHLLDIPDTDIQTIPWERVVEGLMNLRNANPETADKLPAYLPKASKHKQSKQRMDAHDIANRLMRRDNYYIAMVNKEILDLSLPVPFVGNRQFYSKSLELCISFCFENFIFDEQGHVMPSCTDSKSRNKMIEALRRRLRVAAIVSVFMAPFNVGAHCVYYFSRYYAEFRNSPSQLGARAFTPLAEWKMREFNELEHDFRRRIKMAYPFADRYLNQFPKDKMNQALSFVSLITGTIAAVLGIATLLDPELFLGFEITPGRTAFFYLSISMGIFAAARNAVPDDSEVHEPVLHLFEVIEYTHYYPQRWKKQLHSNNVRVEFSALYQMKVLIFLEEILSLVVAPFILWRNSGDQNGLGDLCNHAVFDFRKRKNLEDDDAAKDTDGLREEYFNAKDDKMAMSQYYFTQRIRQYDQQQASRYQRQLHNIPLPPAFPPLSPLREAAGKSNSRSRPRAAVHGSSAVHPIRSTSPHQSILLDLQQKRHPTTHSRIIGQNGPARSERLRKPAQTLEEEVSNADTFHDMTTSKLIEEDNDLAESWKTLPEQRQEDGQQGAGPDAASRANNGVLGLLMEFSKAQAEPKGTRRASNFG